MPRKTKSKKEEVKAEPVAKNLFDDSSSEDDQEDGGVTINGKGPELKINEEYARRFEHNKKREELHRLEEKYKSKDGGIDESDESSTDESEDDEGFLVTEQLDDEIKATLQAIKNKDPRIYDKSAVFYQPIDPDAVPQKEKSEKPVTLRDYHRERYMAGDVGADMEEDDKSKTYNQAQDDLKKSIVAEINAAADDDEEWSDDDAFIKKVEKPEVKLNEDGIHPSRVAPVKLTEADVAKADENPEEFLSKFMASKAWAPPEGSKWEAFNSDEDSSEDDDLADQFENAYNLRFEDPTKANEFLKTYSRNAAAARSVRKEELKGRKKQRALEKEKKEAEKKQREEERARLRRLKIDEAAEKLAKIKQAAGLSGKALKDEDWARLLDDDFDEKWEEEMKKQFGDEYYAEADEFSAGEEEDDDEEGGKKKKKISKPKWDDDIDIKDIIPDFVDDNEVPPNISLSDVDEDNEEEADAGSEDDEGRPSKKRKTSKDIKKDKIAAKREARAELAKIEALVDTKMELENPTVLEKSSTKKGSKGMIGGFRYRETSPNVFGMTARDILLAPSDAALNEFAGLKKLAPFRDAEKKKKDKKRLGKKARLREWRRETFGREFEKTGPTWGFDGEALEGPATGANGTKVDGDVQMRDVGEENGKVANEGGIVEGERKKKRKRSKKSKKAVTAADFEGGDDE
ncbi:KRI1-like family C-terminal domain containing protein [Naviculisporaceae sp. PSN 640]